MHALALAWRAAAVAALSDRGDDWALWRRFAAARSDALRHQLVERYGGYARMLAARQYALRIDRGLAFADFHHFALLGLIECIDRFDPARGIRFESYASQRLRGAIADGVAALSERQRQAAERQRRVRERAASLAATDAGGAAPAPAEAGSGPLERVAHLAIDLALGFMLEDSAMFVDPAAEPGIGDPCYHGAELRATRRLVSESLQQLPAPQRSVLALHYLQGLPFNEIAQQQGLSKGRISQLHRAALLSMRHWLQGRRLQAPECL
jgi:RNA polymerase sigma factor for flagellar operon FliA